MDNIREWAVLLCTAAVASGIIVFLIPDGKLRKTANIVISLFMLSVFVSIFSDSKLPELDLNTDFNFNSSDYSEEINTYLIEQSKATTESIIDEQLSKICSFPYSTDASWTVSDNEITLTNVTITVSQADYSKISTIKAKIGSLTGIIPEVNIK